MHTFSNARLATGKKKKEKRLMLVLFGVIFSLVSLSTLIESSHVQSVCVLWQHKSFLWHMYRIKRNVPTLNQTFLMMYKVIYGLPYDLNEEPWQTYSDVKNSKEAAPVWPYLLRLDDTSEKLITLSDADGSDPRDCLNFSSYSYVNVIKEKEIVDQVFDEVIRGNYAFGNHGPRMLGGNNNWLCKLEKQLGEFTGREAALCYSSGFLACKTVVTAVAGKEDAIFGDSRLHESLRDGIRCAKMKGCKTFTFKHNDFQHLEQLLHKHRLQFKNAYIIIESVYSMDGDYADLCSCEALAAKYGAKIILDEAHGLGILGKTGRGLEELQNCPGAAWLIVGSMTKSLGSVGGYVCGDQKLIDFLHFFSTGTMFSAPMSVPNAIAAYLSLKAINDNPQWLDETRKNMIELTEALKPLESQYGVTVQTEMGSPLIAFIMKDFAPLRVLTLAHILAKKGIYVAAVNPPAVPLREPRLRITAPRDSITSEDIQYFAKELSAACEETKHIRCQTLEELSPFFSLFGI